LRLAIKWWRTVRSKCNWWKVPFVLQGEWQFDELDECCCKIALKLEFEFSNPLIAMAFGQIFTHLTSKMIDAFKQRAREVYHGAN
ncbi:hypothetical protein AAUPMB_01714, partial [Pasteurella multocida subsp. multocida str. Anand1_buffalo]